MSNRLRFSLMAMVVSCAAAVSACAERVPEATVPAALVGAGGMTDPSPSAALLEDCNVERVDGRPASVGERSSSRRILIEGWVAGSLNVSGELVGKPSVRLVRIQGSEPVEEIEFPAQAVAGRDDVAQALGKPGLARAGFQVNADISNLAPGRYTVAPKRGAFTCANVFELQKS
ncbi:MULTISPECIES: hypothetical protein [Stenotrophomonas]|uniref:Lipoprotein n=1 Tax=Stenotrophomonas bentonitica TaxID=1450134 RepID=A0ABU9JN11_9GAMM|nr:MULTISPECIES: hypothetical protein [Stenotrophomonas]MDX5516405.1 hypothetical protein [Stenotrophomonas sp. RG-453]